MKTAKTNIDLVGLAAADPRCTEMAQALSPDAFQADGGAARHWTLQFQADGDKPGEMKVGDE